MLSDGDGPVVGIDLGGTKILTAVTDRQGGIICRDRRKTPADEGKKAVLEAMVQSVHAVLEKARLSIKEVAAVGIGVPGPSNPKTGILHTTPNLPGWRDVPLRDIIADRLDKRSFLINDANAAALAEYQFGAGRGAGSFIYVTVSTGIGGGVVLDGEIYTGASGLAAEIGHMTIDDKGPMCNCGNIGCWEVLASGTALAAEAKRRLEQNEHSTIIDYAGGRIDNVTAEHVQKAAEAGDATAAELLKTTSRYLGTGFANLINLFNPDVIAIGGGMSKMGAMLLEPAYAVAKKRAFANAYAAVRFATAELGADSGVLGAATYARQQAQQSMKQEDF